METKWKNLNEVPNISKRIIVFDTETTGLNHFKHHVAELSAIEIENGLFTGNQFQIFVKPRVHIDPDATFVHGLKDDFFKLNYKGYYLNEKEQLEIFLSFIGTDSLLIGHNSTFDYYYLNDELRYWGLPEVDSSRFRCTYQMSKVLIKSKYPNFIMDNYKLCHCCKFFNITDKSSLFHNALFDSFMVGLLLIKLIKLSHNEIKDSDVNFQCGEIIQTGPHRRRHTQNVYGN